MLQLQKNFLTSEEYFAIEKDTEYKSEYYHGEIFAMAGGTPDHNRISLNLAGSLNTALKGKDCEAFISDLRIQVDIDKHYTYPDVSVICGDLQFAENRKDTITNPILIAEVLSESTKDYDRGSKFTAYRTIETLQNYILIDQKNIHLECFFKENNGIWRLHEYFSLSEILNIESINIKIPVNEIYDRVSLSLNHKKEK
ncbi:putative restriction endonuclease domain-containing protein [Candidatus Magnetomoraceae bacterium gMMP-1]